MPHLSPRRAALLSGLVLLLAAAPAPAPAAAPGDLAARRAQALELLNQDRAAQGLPALGRSDALDHAAQAHAEDMLRRGYFAHEAPDGSTPRDRVLAAGGSASALIAENIARCSGCDGGAERVRAFEQGWMQSPEHRANILHKGLASFGFGMAVDPERRQVVAVQDFAGPGTPSGQGSGAALDDAGAGQAALSAINAARRQAGVPALQASDALDQAAQRLLASQGGSDALQAALAGQAAQRWQSVAALSASCAGCGAHPTGADIRDFVEQWQGQAQYRQRLLDADATHLGFAISADGAGAKHAVAVLGTAR